MLTVAPLSVVLLGILGIAVVLASIARIVVLEHGQRGQVFYAEPGTADRPRVAA